MPALADRHPLHTTRRGLGASARPADPIDLPDGDLADEGLVITAAQAHALVALLADQDARACSAGMLSYPEGTLRVATGQRAFRVHPDGALHLPRPADRIERSIMFGPRSAKRAARYADLRADRLVRCHIVSGGRLAFSPAPR